MSATQEPVTSEGLTLSKTPDSQWNMPDYERFREQFTWDAAVRALGLPRENGVNLASVCIDGHTPEIMRRTALIWRGANGERALYSFDDLRRKTNRFANALTALGIQKGDRVFVFLERIPELYIALFGALKVGAIVGPLFSAFGPDAIRDRLADAGAVLIVTSIDLKDRLESIRADLPALRHVVMVDRKNSAICSLQTHEHRYNALMETASETFTVPFTNPDDASVIHYTSGTTGKPKGAVHRHGAIIAQYATTQSVLDLRPDSDIYWCTADPGWITGTSYGMFGPWSMGASVLTCEGGFHTDTWYRLLQEERVSVWYTAPTAIRMLMKSGDDLPAQYDLSHLRHLCSVGEPLNPEAVLWGVRVFGHVFHDTWWQTETGAMHICNYPCLDVKPGSMGKPVPGVEAAILDDTGHLLPPGQVGNLAIRPDAPSMFRAYWNKPEVYASRFKDGWYITGDRARRDADGYFWFIGRADDVINTAGHLVGPFEVESALIEHPAVAEAAVIGKPDKERLEIVKAFVSLKAGYTATDVLRKEIMDFVRTRLAAHAYPREIDFLEGLPKTRSGKIMRRLLKARELGLPEGDTSTLEE